MKLTMHLDFLFSLFVCSGCCINAAITSPEAQASRTYFYVGGKYLNISGMSFYTDQMYVEQLVPAGNSTGKDPVVFLHGQGQTGTNWLNTPDGREGWASWFLRQGHPVYIVDQPQRGRSAWIPDEGTLGAYSAEQTAMQFTGVQYFNEWPQAHLHTQWPGSGLMGDPIFDKFYATQVQYQNDMVTITPPLVKPCQRLISKQVAVENNTRLATAALLSMISKPVIWIGHSQGGGLSFLAADARPSLIRLLILLEPSGPPFQNRIINLPANGSSPWVRPYGLTTTPIAYDPPVVHPAVDLPSVDYPPPPASGLQDCILQREPAKRLKNLAKVPTLVVTSESSYHAGYDGCTVRYLQQGGVQTTFMNLSAEGVHGNAHFIFMEKNNIQIVEMVYNWISKTVGKIAS